MKLEKILSIFEKVLIILVICMLIFFGIANLILTAGFNDTGYDEYSEKINYVFDNFLINIGLLLVFFIVITKLLPRYVRKVNIYLIAFIHFLLGIFWALFSKAPCRADQLMVTEIAKQFLNGDFSALNPGGYLCHHPMQLSIVYYAKWIYAFFGIQDNVIFFVLNSLYSMITLIFVYKIGILIFDKEKVENNLKFFIFGFFILDILSIFIYGNLLGLACAVVSLYYLFKYYKFNKKINLLVSVIFMIFSMSIKSNFLVYYIGFAISLIIYGLKNKCKLKLLISIISIIIIFTGYKTIEFAFVNKTEKTIGKEISKGNPMISYIQMGMAEKIDRAAGWYNAGMNVEKVFTENEYDVEKTKKSSVEYIKKRCYFFIKNPKSMVKYYLDKILSTWTEPAFQSIWQAEPQEAITPELKTRIESNKILLSFYDGNLNKVMMKYFDIYAIALFLFSSIYLIKNIKNINLEIFTLILIFFGGVCFHILWETKCLYVIPYYILLMPFAANGIEIMKEGLKMSKIKTIIERVKIYYKKYGFLTTLKKCIKKVIYKILGKSSRDLRAEYMSWIKNNEPNEEELKKQREHKFEKQPKISIIVPMYNTPEIYFKDLVECMQNQTYTNWELCLADGSPEENIELRKYYEKDDRVKYKFLGKNDGISGNTNEALKLVTGDYIGLLDHDDALPIFAMYEIVKTINENPEVEFIYTDEDKIEGVIEKRCDPHFKPDYAPDTLACHNYITHLVVMKKNLIEKLGGFRKEYNGAQDFDLVLRASEETKNIIHIPKILYHWRVHPQSTAMVSDSKPYAYEAGKRASQDHQIRLGREAVVDHGGDVPGIYNVQYKVKGNPKVSILIPNKDGLKFLKSCVNSILELTTYSNYEIIIIENNSENTETFEYYKELEKNKKIKVLMYPEKGFNYSKIINYGVKNCDGEFVLQLNNDTKLLTKDWLEKFIGYSQRSEIGAVGARLYFGDKSIQHAGIAYGICDLAANLFPGLAWGNRGYYGKDALIQNISAVTGACLFCRRELYEEVGYMEEEKFAVAFNDVDFCLKLREKGYLNIYNPYIELMHYESKTRGYEVTPEKNERFAKECENFKEKWKELLKKPDPYYNQNLSRNTANYDVEVMKIKY